MSKLGNRIKVGVSAIPGGAQGTLTLGSPEDGFFDFAEGGELALPVLHPKNVLKEAAHSWQNTNKSLKVTKV